jgi:glucosamine kinase
MKTWRKTAMESDALLLGVDGGGTRCRARLCTASGARLGEGEAGPANIRYGLEDSITSVLQATGRCLDQAGLSGRDLPRITACLALAGASEPMERAAAQRRAYPFRHTMITADAHAACTGAHGGQDGGVVVAGTGAIGWAVIGGRQHRIGGWGLPISDEGSGAWLGCEALRGVLWAHDGRIGWTNLLRSLFAQFQHDPHAIVRWVATATPRDFAAFMPLIVAHAQRDDPAGVELMRRAAGHVDMLVMLLNALGAQRVALVGGLAPHLHRWIPRDTRSHLVEPAGDALAGALQLARAAANAVAA